jgi:peptidoglycan/xylan/chitin deacetylase (PgdA/CDA1 family)
MIAHRAVAPDLLVSTAMRPLLLLALIGCHTGPLNVTSIEPSEGSVAGGTRVTIHGGGFDGAHVTIGGVDCGSVSVDDDHLTCTTGDRHFQEGVADVVVTTDAGTATLAGAFTYACTWTTSTGRRSCGAAPAPSPPEQQVASWITQMDPGSGFVANAGITNLGDTSDFTLGPQSALVETVGTGAVRTLAKTGMSPIDFTGKVARVWVKLEGVEHLGTLEIQLGSNNLTSAFEFSLRTGQSRQWFTDGDWVSIAVPWTPTRVAGIPDRAHITDVMVRVSDDATGNHVRLHLNGIALVAEATPALAGGVVTFDFDDNFATMVDPGATILSAHGFPATAYIITDMVGGSDRASLSDLENLASAGWDIAAHAYTEVDHALNYANLTPADVEDDMVNTRAWLISNGFTGYDHCAYPSGEFTPAVLALADQYFTSCRTIYSSQQELFPPSDSRRLRVGYVTEGVTLAQAEQWVAEAAANHEWLILVFHRIVDAPSLNTEWPTTSFQALTDYVAASGLPVKTVSEVYATDAGP